MDQMQFLDFQDHILLEQIQHIEYIWTVLLEALDKLKHRFHLQISLQIPWHMAQQMMDIIALQLQQINIKKICYQLHQQQLIQVEYMFRLLDLMIILIITIH